MAQQKQEAARIHGQLSAIMAAVDAVGKNRRNSGQGFNFRGIEDIMDALHPIFAEHKVFILSEVLDEKTEERSTAKGGSLIYRILKVRVSFVSGDDGSRESVVVVGEGMDSGDKAANKAMSAALKYALTQTLILPYAQVDADGETPPDSHPKDGAPAAAAAGKMRSAHDGRVLKPGESPLPKKTPPAEEKDTGQKAKTDENVSAFHTRLYDAMALVAVTEDELKALLIKKGVMTADMEVGNLQERIVNLILDGKDSKTGRPNWELIVKAIEKGRAS